MDKEYKLEIEEVLKLHQTSLEGLSFEEAEKRLRHEGYNEIPKKKTKSILSIFIEQFNNPLTLLLIATIIISLLIREWVDAIAVTFIVLVDAFIATFEEYKALRTADSLHDLIKKDVKVLRDKEEIVIPSRDLVRGDIILLTSGDKVPADARLFEALNLRVDESILTGESLPEEKKLITYTSHQLIADRENMVFSGTNVLTGRAKAIVVETGLDTELGKIAASLNEEEDAPSPLTLKLEHFTKQISSILIIFAIMIAITLYLKDYSFNEIFLSVTALTVSAMPEGLPLALTMALTVASNKMTKKGVVVKKLNAVETLGSTTVIATDKTGTLTVNEQTASKIVAASGEVYNVTGTGYNFEGEVIGSDIEKALYIARLGKINNEASLIKHDTSYEYLGDSVDIAFLSLAGKLNIPETYEVLDILPYESEKAFSGALYQENNQNYLTIKGSLEKILSFSTTMGPKKTPLNIKHIMRQHDSLSKEGYRVIALAEKEMTSETKAIHEEDINNFNFAGLVAFIDPIRDSSKEAIARSLDAGIKVYMITGDHPLTALKIAKDLGLITSDSEVATAKEFNEAYDKGLDYFKKYIRHKLVFSRVTPLDKLKIIKALQDMGEFVAVTGDGVNDAPAIKAANIGIAMGSGTDVAKETADMIITDDNFASIVEGIYEGRSAYSNIRKVSYMLLSCGLAEVLFFMLAIIFNMPVPLLAIQLLWLNIVTDGLQDLALSFEKAPRSIMREKPVGKDEELFNKSLMKEVLVAGSFIGISVFLIWYFLIKKEMPAYNARAYIMTLMVFMQNIHVLNCKSEKESIFKIKLFDNKFLIFSILTAIILQIIVMENDLLSKLLKAPKVPYMHMLYLFGISLIVLIVMEIYKYVERKRVKA